VVLSLKRLENQHDGSSKNVVCLLLRVVTNGSPKRKRCAMSGRRLSLKSVGCLMGLLAACGGPELELGAEGQFDEAEGAVAAWSFRPSPNNNAHWVQVTVTPPKGSTAVKVEAILNGSRWITLERANYGDYVANPSTAMPLDASVVYRAWDSAGRSNDSAAFSLVGGAPTGSSGAGGNDGPAPGAGSGGGSATPPATTGSGSGQFNYGEAYQLSTLFFAWNAMGTLSDTRLPQRRSSSSDGALSGGYTDAGDNILFGNAHHSTVAQMGFSTFVFKAILERMGQYDESLKQLKHGTDWLLKSHEIENGRTKSLVVQLSDSPTDHPKWLSIEETNFARPVYRVSPSKPGSDYAGLAAAAMALGALNFDGDYRNRLISSARIVFEFGKSYRGLGENNGVKSVYKNSNGDTDELALGAMALYLATNEQSYLDYAENTLNRNPLGGWVGGFEHQEHLATLLLAHYGRKSGRADALRRFFNEWKPGGFGGNAIATGEGYVLYKIGWGSAGAVAPTLNYMGLWHTLTGEGSWKNFVTKQMNYNLGANSRRTSLLCGFRNEKNCSRIHHRGSSGGSRTNYSGNNLYQLWGGFLAGPTNNDFDWKNDRNDWKGNEPTTTYNVNFQGALAYLYAQYGGDPMADSALQSRLNGWSGY
jgi:endoglucanase